jgi:hypothetical protein
MSSCKVSLISSLAVGRITNGMGLGYPIIGLSVKSKAIPLTGRRGSQVCELEAPTISRQSAHTRL